MEPEQYRRDREEFFAWFDHFKNWALKDHFHDERYALVKHPHVKADITDWAHRTCTTTSSAAQGAGSGSGAAAQAGGMIRSDQVEELIGLTLEDQRALFDALEQRRRADEEAAAKTEEND
eukprot:tig00001033_g6508.t1